MRESHRRIVARIVRTTPDASTLRARYGPRSICGSRPLPPSTACSTESHRAAWPRGACPVDHDRIPSARGDASKGLRHPGGTPVNSTRKQMDVSSSAPAVGATPGRAVVQVQFILKFPGRAPSRAARSTSCSGGWESDRSSRPAEAPRDSSKIDWAGAEAGAKMSVGPQCGRMACPNAAPIDINAVPPGQQMWRSNRRASLGLRRVLAGKADTAHRFDTFLCGIDQKEVLRLHRAALTVGDSLRPVVQSSAPERRSQQNDRDPDEQRRVGATTGGVSLRADVS